MSRSWSQAVSMLTCSFWFFHFQIPPECTVSVPQRPPPMLKGIVAVNSDTEALGQHWRGAANQSHRTFQICTVNIVGTCLLRAHMFPNETTRSALVLKKAWRQQLRMPQIRQLETAWTAAEKDGGRRRARAEETGGAGGGSLGGPRRTENVEWGLGAERPRRGGAGRNNARRVGMEG